MRPEDLQAFFDAFGVLDVAEFIEAAVIPMIDALEGAARNLRSLGLKQYDDLVGRETERLVELLGAAVQVRPRDYFPHDAHGWGGVPS
jgi:hypothetical protein